MFQAFKKFRVTLFLLLGLSGAAYANTLMPTDTTGQTDSPPVQEVYQDGLIAVVYVQGAKSGTWASPERVGTPIAEFVDNRTPRLSFANLQDEPAAWAVYPGSLVGVEWVGYFFAEEDGEYSFLIDFTKEKDSYFHINSAVMDLKISDKSIVKNEVKIWQEQSYFEKSPYQHISANSIHIKKGYYPISIWLHCGVTRDKWTSWITQAGIASWTIKIKRPSDRTVQPAPKGTLVWK